MEESDLWCFIPWLQYSRLYSLHCYRVDDRIRLLIRFAVGSPDNNDGAFKKVDQTAFF